MKRLLLFLLPLLVLVTLGVVRQTEAQHSLSATKPTLIFEGTSSNGNFQDALDQALAAADAHAGTIGADIRYGWRLTNTEGVRGGFLFFNDLTVRIEAKF